MDLITYTRYCIPNFYYIVIVFNLYYILSYTAYLDKGVTYGGTFAKNGAFYFPKYE